MRHCVNCDHHQGCTLAEGNTAAPEGLRVGMSLQEKHCRISTDRCRQLVVGMGLAGRGGAGRVC